MILINYFKGMQLLALAIIYLCYFSNAALSQTIQLKCPTSANVDTKISCDLSVGNEIDQNNFEIFLNGKKDPKAKFVKENAIQETQATLVLIDQSNPNRKSTIRVIKKELSSFVSQANDQNMIGLAVFAANFKEIAPIGSAANDLASALNGIKAQGDATELYKSALDAIKRLSKIKAKKKTLLILSDGKAEDKAYTIEEVIEFAKQNSVVINTWGYAEKPSQTPDLQTLEKLSSRTGGQYISADIASKKLPQNFIANYFKGKTPDGKIQFQSPPKFIGELEVLINGFSKKDNSKYAANAKINISSVSGSFSIFKNKLLIAILVGLLVLILVLIALMIRHHVNNKKEENRRRQQLQRKQEQVSKSELEQNIESEPEIDLNDISDSKPTLAVIIVIGNEKKPILMISNPTIVGRSKKSDLILENTSVSRSHAKIQINENNKIEVIDLNSTNGTKLNGKKISKAEVTANDLIAFGEVQLRITQVLNHEEA